MNVSARILIAVAVCLVVCRGAHAQEDEEQARKFAEAAIRIGAIDYLTDREFKLDGEEIVATGRAMDPKEHVKVKLIELELLPGRADLKCRIDCRFRLDGKLTVDDSESDFRGEANVGQLFTVEAKYWSDDRGSHIDAKITELKFSIKIHELYPENAGGGKTPVAKIILKQLGKQKEDLLREINEWQAEYTRNFR
jgi:hypothetical protein